MMTRAADQAGVLGEEPMKTGDADVVEAVDGVAHELGRDRRLFRDGQVGRSGGRDDDGAASRGELAERERNGSGQFVEFCRRLRCADTASNARRSVRVTSRLWPGGDDALGDGGDLFRRLSRPKNDLRASLPERAMVVDAGEAQVFERGLAQILKKAVLGDLRREGAGANVAQERSSSSARVMSPDCFDFGASPALI